MPSNAATVANYLKSNKNRYFCQSCLMAATNVRPQAQMNQIVRPLEQSSDYRYSRAPCSQCERNLKCIVYVG